MNLRRLVPLALLVLASVLSSRNAVFAAGPTTLTGTFADGTMARYHACDILTLRDGRIAAKRSYRKLVE